MVTNGDYKMMGVVLNFHVTERLDPQATPTFSTAVTIALIMSLSEGKKHFLSVLAAFI